MKKTITPFYFFALLFFCACTNNSDSSQNASNEEVSIPIKPRIKYIKSEINNLLSLIRPKIQEFSINNNIDSFLVGESGTLLFIPKGTFLNDRNQIVKGEIKIELIEAFDISDFILNGLQTVSNEKVLESGGMIFIDATQNNQPLKIDPNKDITVEIKTDRINPKMELFTSDLSDSLMNWTKLGKLESDYLISVPLKLLEFSLCGWECGFTKGQISGMKKSEFQGTYISTREFEQRMCNLAFLSCEYYDPLDDEILKIYKDNVSENLSYADSMVAKHLEEKYHDLIDTNYIRDKFKFDEKGWITGIYKSYLTLAKQGLTKPPSLNGIDWDSNISRPALEKKGYSNKDIDKITSYRNLRNRVIQEKKDEVENKNIASYNFRINKLGWINIDAFMNDFTCQESNFEVDINNKDSISSMNVSLVIPRRNVSIFSIHNIDNTYSFTQKKDGYRKLPIDEKAYIVAIGVKAGKPYWGAKEIKIPKEGTIKLKIEETEKDEIAKKIKEISEM